jgi:hypothetical protein
MQLVEDNSDPLLRVLVGEKRAQVVMERGSTFRQLCTYRSNVSTGLNSEEVAARPDAVGTINLLLKLII